MNACRLLLPCILIASAFRPAPAEEMKSLEILPMWKKGEALRYEMTRVQLHENDGKVVRKTNCRTPLEVEVLESDDEGYVLRWTQGKTVFDDPKLDDEPFIKLMNAVLKGADIELEFDKTGGFVGMRNWKDVKATGVKIRDATLTQMGKSGTPKDTLTFLRTETDKMFATKESIETSFTKQPVLLFAPLGKMLDAAKPTIYEDELPNPFGGDPFPTKGEIALKSVNKNAGTALVTFKQTPDPKEVTGILRKSLDELAKKMGKTPPDSLPEFKLEDALEYEVDLKTGWVKSVTHTRTTKLDTTTQSEVLTITRRDK
ncbi:MAG: hypothetical protein L0241_15500 [Planctomycetia bacterium]|nr:hypothetical protein [Planctomycetia bacterium]